MSMFKNLADGIIEKANTEKTGAARSWDSIVGTVKDKFKDTMLWINPELSEGFVEGKYAIGSTDPVVGPKPWSYDDPRGQDYRTHLWEKESLPQTEESKSFPEIGGGWKKLWGDALLPETEESKVPNIPYFPHYPDDVIEQPYLIQPVSKTEFIEDDYIIRGEKGKDPTLLSSANLGLIADRFPRIDSVDKDKQAFLNVAALTEIKSVADENGTYDMANVEKVTQDVADYYTARQALDEKFGKGDGLHEMAYDDKTQAAMDAGYEAALAELNKQYGDDTVSLYNKTQEKIGAYEEAKEKYGTRYTNMYDAEGNMLRGMKMNPDYDPDFAKNNPDFADVAYANGEMSADDYKEASGQVYESNDISKNYVSTRGMSKFVSKFVLSRDVDFSPVRDRAREADRALGLEAENTGDWLKDGIKSVTTLPIVASIGDKLKEAYNDLYDKGSKFAETEVGKTLYDTGKGVLDTAKNIANGIKTRGYEFENIFGKDSETTAEKGIEV